MLRPTPIQTPRLTMKEAALLLGCPSDPLKEETRARLGLACGGVRSFSPTDVRSVLGEDYTRRLSASLISWRNALATLVGTARPSDIKNAPLYRVIIDVDALQSLVGMAKPTPVKENDRAGASTYAPGIRPH